MTRAAHAKANLALAITGRRPDGYHELASVVLRLALHDELEVAVAGRGPDTLAVDGDPDCPVEGNLVLRAAEAVRERSGRRLPSLAFHLTKRIPIAAGLGGGSSDAAAALDLAAAAWHVDLGADERLELAASLGADVPFFASGHAAALVEGVGERVLALRAPDPPAGVLLVTPPIRLSTALVYAASDAAPSASLDASAAVHGFVERLTTGMSGGDLAAMAGERRDANDLWPAAATLAPDLFRLRADLESALARPVLMTGSGSTLLALYPSSRAVADAAHALAAARPASVAGARITMTTTTDGEGPG